ncbi:sestrin-3 [Stigmatopora argus]
MIICTNKMEYPLRSQRVQKQVATGRGGVDAVSRQMASHPQYLESFLRAQHYILHVDGPLPLPCRHYIAIMAAARHHCDYLVYVHSAHFLRLGGDPLWLRGLEAAPPRLRLLDHINKVLAHRPWLATCSHIKTLLKCGEQCWSLAELVQAVVVLAHCHSLCSFIFGSDADTSADGRPLSPDSAGDKTTQWPCVDANSDMRERIHKVQEERDKREEYLQADIQEDDESIFSAEPSRFVTEPDFSYQEFARRDDDNHFQVFRVQDYSWEDHGFSLVNRLYSDVGHLLDDRFRSVTAPSAWPHGPDLKRAVWNYIHYVLGIRYDDYDYGDVGRLLGPDLKAYVKTVACFPDAGKNPPGLAALKTSERIDVNLLIMEARLQAELLYALRAITQYMIA